MLNRLYVPAATVSSEAVGCGKAGTAEGSDLRGSTSVRSEEKGKDPEVSPRSFPVPRSQVEKDLPAETMSSEAVGSGEGWVVDELADGVELLGSGGTRARNRANRKTSHSH